MVELWLWIAVISMAVGAAAFLLHGLTSPPRDDREEKQSFLSFSVPLIAAIAYLAMAVHQADFLLGDRDVYWGRYADWAITTPLLLMHFVVMLQFRRVIVAGLIFSDVLMIVTGFAGALADHSENLQYLWWTVSTGAFIAVLALLFTRIGAHGRREHDAPRTRLAMRLAVMLTVLWVCYPILWLFGTTGNGAVSPGYESLVYTVLDLVAKVGFGLAVTLGVRALPHPATGRTSDAAPAATTDAPAPHRTRA